MTWRKVSDGLPEQDIDVLVWQVFNGKSGQKSGPLVAFYHGDWIEPIEGRSLVPLVTHWMPLPEPPSE